MSLSSGDMTDYNVYLFHIFSCQIKMSSFYYWLSLKKQGWTSLCLYQVEVKIALNFPDDVQIGPKSELEFVMS